MLRPHDFIAAEVSLERWGGWVERSLERSGYPQMYEVWTASKGPSGHKVLCGDMPPKVWRVNQIVLRMPADIRETCWARFVFVLDEHCQPIPEAEKIKALGISIGQFHRRIAKAKRIVASNISLPLDNTVVATTIRDQTGLTSLIRKVLTD